MAERVISDDADVDAAREKIEARCFKLLALQQPVASDLRMLVAALRMVGELERMGDLSVHVAKVARLQVPSIAIPGAELVPTIERMAAVAERMVDQAASVIAERDVEAPSRSRGGDEEMDEPGVVVPADARRRLGPRGPGRPSTSPCSAATTSGSPTTPMSLARRVVYLVTGQTIAAEAP